MSIALTVMPGLGVMMATTAHLAAERQDQVTSTAENLAQLAPTAVGRAMEENRQATGGSGPC